MKTLFTIVLSIISLIVYSQNDDFEQNIKKMLEIQGIEKNWEMLLAQMIQLQKESNPDIETEFWDRFKNEILTDSYKKLYEITIPIYKKYLTKDEVIAIINFYESDAGKSLISKTPFILKEAMEAGEKLGKDIGTQIAKEIEEEKNKNFNSKIFGCEKFKIGKFKYIMPDSSVMFIQRDEKYQYEYYLGNTTKYKIKWIDDCTYTLDILKSDADYVKNAKGEILTTNIYEVHEKYYKYVCTINGKEFKMDGIIYLDE